MMQIHQHFGYFVLNKGAGITIFFLWKLISALGRIPSKFAHGNVLVFSSDNYTG